MRHKDRMNRIPTMMTARDLSIFFCHFFSHHNYLFMNIQFRINGKYTLVSISGMAITIRDEIVITEIDEEKRKCFFRMRGKRKQFYITCDHGLANYLIFERHSLPFTVDTETSSFWANSKFNFVTDKPDELKLFIEENCLNPSQEAFRRVFYSGSDRNGIDPDKGTPLFPEKQEFGTTKQG